MTNRPTRWAGVAAPLVVLIAACSGSSAGDTDASAADTIATTAPTTAAPEPVVPLSLEPAASAGSVVDVRDFGAVTDDGIDDTESIQTAIDTVASAGGGTVVFPAGDLLAEQILWRRGVNLVGSVTGRGGDDLGSNIVQADGAADSLVISDPTVPGEEFFHWTAIENLRLTGAADGSGVDGISVRSRAGENFRIHRVIVAGFPRHGISLTRGGAPTVLSDLHLFGNGVTGLSLSRQPEDRYQTLRAELVSGDDNGLALVQIEGVGASEEIFHLSDLKIESSIEGRQPYGVVLDDTNVAHVFIENMSAIATQDGAMDALVLVRNSDARFWLEGFRRNDERVAAVVEDEFRETTFSEFGDLLAVYNAGRVTGRIGPSGIASGDGVELRPVQTGRGSIESGDETVTVSHGLGPDAVITVTPRGDQLLWIDSVTDTEFTVRRSNADDPIDFEWIGSIE
ncbi:MAG: glycosyl hydrolase family 28-related protein [Actinomycetota bacterium]